MAVLLKNEISSAKKMGLKPAQEPPVKSFQHKKKVWICFILPHFWDETTFEHIKRWLGADFEETHFFQRRPVTFEHLNIGILEHWNIGTFEHWNIGTLENWNIWTSKHLNIGILECLNIGKFEHWNIGTFEHMNIWIFEHLNIWTLKHYKIETFEHI